MVGGKRMREALRSFGDCSPMYENTLCMHTVIVVMLL
jgi:hypothetical protein